MGKYIKNKKCNNKSRSVASCFSHVAYALIAAVAASAPLTASAADLFWSGEQTGVENTEESPYNIWDPANWGGTTPSQSYDLKPSVSKRTYLNSANGSDKIANDFRFMSGDFVLTGPLYVNALKVGCEGSATVLITKKNGDWSFVYDMNLAYSSGTTAEFVNESGNATMRDVLFGYSDKIGGTGTLTIKGGTVTVRIVRLALSGHNATLNLDGGTLLAKEIHRNDGAGNMYINFNGGTLKANGTNNENLIYSSGIQVEAHVNANGGVIDCSGNPITLSMPYGFIGTGSLTFTGGNTITLSCNDNNNVYEGVTSVTTGTTVRVSQDRAGKMLAKGVALVGDLELNTPYTILASKDESDDWSSLDLSKVTCPSASAFTADLGADNKSITVTVTAFKPSC